MNKHGDGNKDELVADPAVLKPKIAIIGAGPAGCTLAKLLLDANIHVVVYEGESSLNVRSQGGTLDLHTSTGLKALQQAGLYKDFLKYARFDGEALKLVDKQGTAFISVDGTKDSSSSRGRPEIDRLQLRQLLLDGLPPGTVRWGMRLESVDPIDLSLVFRNGCIEGGFDLIVGADGAWSKIRPVLSTVKPYYVGIGGIGTTIHNASTTHAKLSAYVNRGSVFAFSDGKSLFFQQQDHDIIKVYAYSIQPDESWPKTCGFDVNDFNQVTQAIARDYFDWDAQLRDAFKAGDSKDLTHLSLYQLPSGHSWTHRVGVTLIGDAAHLMTPFAGEGVNLAMTDAMELANHIIKAKSSGGKLDASIQTFESSMFVRADAINRLTESQMKLMYFTPGAPFTSIEKYIRNAVGGASFDAWWLKLLLPLPLLRFLLRWYFKW